MEQYVTPEEARKHFRVSDNTLRKWEKEGKLEAIRIGPSGTHRRYKIILENNIPTTRKRVCYARVSSREQKEDLERQISVLKHRYPNHELIKDIGSGLNFKRKGFRSLLERTIRGDIQEIVVTNKDRLCRFGFELFEDILSGTDGGVVVLYNEDRSPEQELAEDVLAVLTVFSSRLYGRRSGRNKRNERENMDDNGQRESKVQNSEV